LTEIIYQYSDTWVEKNSSDFRQLLNSVSSYVDPDQVVAQLNQSEQTVSALAYMDKKLVGFLGGVIKAGNLEAKIFISNPDEDHKTITTKMFEKLNENFKGKIQIWVSSQYPSKLSTLQSLGLKKTREVVQLECQLPVNGEYLPTQKFTDSNTDELIQVNNLAFTNHPDQGDLNQKKFQNIQNEKWYKHSLIRVFKIRNSIAGFCWIKPHVSKNAGEIYVLAIHPDHQGKGLGKKLLRSGLTQIQHLGFSTAFLFTEADNHLALNVYKKIGFRIVRSDIAMTTS